jgi:uncharacterized protein
MSFDPSSHIPVIPISRDHLRDLLAAVRRQYRLSWTGIHGAGHWARVLDTGLRLAAVTGADPEVVTLFALFHDACRANDGHDPRHGARGAELAASVVAAHFAGRTRPLQLLLEACTLHTHGLVEADVTVATCWDADRLDLLRAGITPAPHKLCTDAARDSGTIEWACDRSRSNHIPSLLADDWLHAGPEWSFR